MIQLTLLESEFLGHVDRDRPVSGDEPRVRRKVPSDFTTTVAYLTVRTDDKLGRVTLDVEPVLGDTKTGMGNEAEATLAMLRRTVERLPGTRGIIVDSVLRGKHITDLAAEGLIVVNYPHAQANPHARKQGRFAKGRVEKSTKAYVHTHTYKSDAGVECSCQHDIYVYGTVYHQLGYDAAGQQIPVTLDVKNLVQRKNADGTYRWYHQLKVPCVHGDQTVLVALFHNPRKKSRGIRIPNRGEYLRAFPTNTIQHKILYGRRNDTESRHRQDKRTQPKMVAYGPEAQSLYNLGGAVFDNAMFRGHRLKRAGLPNPLDAT